MFNDGHLYEGNFKKGHIDLSEFLVQCRLNGFFDLKELQTAILEKMANNGPVTEDMKRTVAENIWHDSLVNWLKSFR